MSIVQPVVEESVCQKCRAKESEKPLHRCPRCLVVSFCEDCSTADSTEHRWICRVIVEVRNKMESAERELREEHNIPDPYQLGPGRRYRWESWTIARKNPISFALWHYAGALCCLSDNHYELALEANSRELWEAALVWKLKALRMYCESPSNYSFLVPQVAEILIRLNRLDGAYCFINEFMAFRAAVAMDLMPDMAMPSMWKEVSKGEPGACLDDCLPWVRSNFTLSYPHSSDSENDQELFIEMLKMLLVIKLWVRVPAAQREWERTLKDVFFQTDMGSTLEEVYPILKEMVLVVEDDHENMEQIRSLCAIMNLVDHTKLRWALADTGWANLYTKSFDDTTDVLAMLREELCTDDFKERCDNEPLRTVLQSKPKTKKKGILKFLCRR